MLIKLWRWLFGACEHKWKEESYCSVIDDNGYKMGDKHTLKCMKCGNMKVFKAY